ncbi:hypothetical protein [Aeromonas dhakensis]|uniref:hypothetical protein n=1 Tax=Aeromonas dhakensis TaxID=196024 RepID=UPI003BA091E9
MTSWISVKSIIILSILTIVNGGYNWIVFTPSDTDSSMQDKAIENVVPIAAPVKYIGNPFTVTRERVEAPVSDDTGPDDSKNQALELRLVAISMRSQERVAVFQGKTLIAVKTGEQLAGVGKVINIFKRQVEIEKDSKIKVFEIFPIPVQPQ